jgi:hypothetical protein
MAPEEDIKAEPDPMAVAPLVAQRVSDLEVSGRWLQVFLANRAIALGWALKGCCKSCAHRLFTTARWLVPEAQRFLVRRTGSYNCNFEFAADLGTLRSHMRPRGVIVGFLIVVVLVGLLDLAVRSTATGTQPLAENSAFQHEFRTPLESKVLSVSKSSEPMEGFVSETASVSGEQIAPPLPLRKPARVFKAPNGKAAKAKPIIQKRMAQQKRARPKPVR